jgi:hypothetical protein
VVITTRVPISAKTLAQCPKLKIVAVLAIGTDMIDLAACKEKGVLVSNVPAASKEPLLCSRLYPRVNRPCWHELSRCDNRPQV